MTNNTNSTKKNKEALNKFKMEVASELGVDLSNKNITSREAGSVGGSMVKKMISEYKSKMK